MSASISATDPILRNLANTLNASNPAELNDVVWLINQSPTLISQLLAIQNANSNVSVTFSAAGSAATTFGGPALDVTQPSATGDGNIITTGGSLVAQQDNITPAGKIVGDLAQAAGRWLNNADTLASSYYNDPAYSVERFLADQFTLDGKALFNDLSVKSEVEGSEKAVGWPSSMQTGNVWFDDGAGAYASTIAIKQIKSFNSSNLPPACSISFLASQVWNTPANQPLILAEVKAAGSDSGPANPLNVDWSHLSNFTVDVATNGTLLSSTITTNFNGVIRNYATTYTDADHETTYVSDSNYNLLETVVLDATTKISILNDYSETIVADGSTLVQSPDTLEAFEGQDNMVHLESAMSATVSGNGNFVAIDQGYAPKITGNGNTIYTNEAGTPLTVELTGDKNEVLFGSNTITVAGSATNTVLYGGSGSLTFNAGSGILVLGSGSATVTGASAGQTLVVFGGSGSILYNGQNESADVIGGNADTIHAGAGGGWYQGGGRGHNLLVGSNSGTGTVLQGSGGGDTLTGGSAGGTYLLAGAGNETLNGGNGSGEALFFLGSGQDVVDLGTGYSIVDGGSGTATIVGAGSGEVYGGTGGADLYTVVSGETVVNGFRVGTDHVGGGGTAATQGANTLVTLSNGAKIELVGVASTAHLFG